VKDFMKKSSDQCRVFLLISSFFFLAPGFDDWIRSRRREIFSLLHLSV